jgi:hypothetical protein
MRGGLAQVSFEFLPIWSQPGSRIAYFISAAIFIRQRHGVLDAIDLGTTMHSSQQ